MNTQVVISQDEKDILADLGQGLNDRILAVFNTVRDGSTYSTQEVTAMICERTGAPELSDQAMNLFKGNVSSRLSQLAKRNDIFSEPNNGRKKGARFLYGPQGTERKRRALQDENIQSHIVEDIQNLFEGKYTFVNSEGISKEDMENVQTAISCMNGIQLMQSMLMMSDAYNTMLEKVMSENEKLSDMFGKVGEFMKTDVIPKLAAEAQKMNGKSPSPSPT